MTGRSSQLNNALDQCRNIGISIDSMDIEKPLDENGNNALHIACDKGELDVVKSLIVSGSNINSKSFDDFTPLHCAAISGHANICHFLIAEGADINSVAQDGRSSLHWAVWNSNIDAVKTLVSNGCNTSIKDNNGWTALYIAVLHDELEIVSYLLKNGASISESKDLNGKELMHIADSDLMKELLEYSPDSNIALKNPSRISSPESTSRNMNRSVNINDISVNRDVKTNKSAAFLIEFEDPTKNIQKTVNFKSNLSSSKVLILEVPDETKLIDAETACHKVGIQFDKARTELHLDKDENTALHLACKLDQLHVVKKLLAVNVNPNCINKYGRIPLHFSAMNGNYEITKVLIEACGEVNKKSKNGRTPLHESVENDQYEVTELLIESGALLDVKNNLGFAPLHYSKTNELTDLLTKKKINKI